MNSKSTKQRAKDRAIGKIRETREKTCVLCGRPASEMCHLLPKSLWMEHYTNPDNLVIMCRSCHTLHDDNIEFRSTQEKLFKQALKVDELGAKRYYKRQDPIIKFEVEPIFEWIKSYGIIEKQIELRYNNYYVDCKFNAAASLEYSPKSDYVPESYDGKVDITFCDIKIFDEDGEVVNTTEQDKIENDIKNFIKENL